MAWVGAKVDYHLRNLPDMWGGRGAFNGQQRRVETMAELLEALHPAAIVETGTYLGSTTEWLARTTGVPVFTVEMNARYYFYARTRLRRLKNVAFRLSDSRTFLASAAGDPIVAKQNVLFYLDAHARGSQPLAEELVLIKRHWSDSVVVIDDFRVDDDDGYGFDGGDEWQLGLALVPEGFVAYYPRGHSSEETGGRRGAAFLATGLAIRKLDRVASIRRVTPTDGGA